MKNLFLGFFILFQFGFINHLENNKSVDFFSSQIAAQCYNTGSEIQGNIKFCYYNCGGATMYTTIDMFSTCPFTINV
jgi:hypothetical protein